MAIAPRSEPVPGADVAAGLSPSLAALDLTSVTSAELADLVTREAARLWGASHAVAWTYEPALGRLFAEPDVEGPRSFDLAPDQVDELFADPSDAAQPGEVHRRLADASFGLARDDASGPLTVPLRLDGANVGVVLLLGPEVSPDSLRDRAQPFAAQAAAALVNHRALEQRRRHESQLEALYRTAGELSAQLELQQVLEAIIERSCGLVGAPIGYILLLDRKADEITMRAASGVSTRAFREIRLRIGAGLGGRAAQAGKPFYTSDYLNDDRFRHQTSVDEAVRGEGIKSILGVPMRRGDDTVGVLFVADRAVRVYASGDVDVLVSLAQHAALAIENARLYEQATQAVEATQRAGELARSQNVLLRRVDDAQRRLSEAILSGHGMAAIAELIGELVAGHVVVLDDHHRPLATAGSAPDDFGATLASRGLTATLRRAPGVAAVVDAMPGWSTVTLPAQGAARAAARLVAPVVGGGEVLGSLWVQSSAATAEEERPIVDQGARAVALELLKERTVAEVERRQRHELLDDLLADRLNRESVQRRGAELGLDLAVPYRLVLARRPRGGADLVGALRAQPWCAFVAHHRGGVVALLDARAGDIEGRVQELLRRVAPRAAGLQAVISSPCNALEDYRDCHRAAQRILDLLADAATPVVDLDRTRVLGLLFRDGAGDELRAFVEHRLGPLLAKESSRTELVATLEAYLGSGCSPARTAAALHVHVNTVYYRLDRLRDALGPDFAEPRRALDLHVACLGRRLLRGQRPD